MFWQKKEKIIPRVYIHICFSCGSESKLEKKLDHCPKCKKAIDEVYEHINRHIGPGWTYYYGCDVCKVRFDTDIKEGNPPCPLCQKPSESHGYSIGCKSHYRDPNRPESHFSISALMEDVEKKMKEND